MKFPFSKIFRSHTRKIPDSVVRKLKEFFPEAINIEWERKEKFFEAIFYLTDVEHIAQFSDKGDLLQYKKNLWPAEIPEYIRLEGAVFGEIMNCIVITKGSNLFYELIIRDSSLDRYVYLFDIEGKLLESNLL